MRDGLNNQRDSQIIAQAEICTAVNGVSLQAGNGRRWRQENIKIKFFLLQVAFSIWLYESRPSRKPILDFTLLRTSFFFVRVITIQTLNNIDLIRNRRLISASIKFHHWIIFWSSEIEFKSLQFDSLRVIITLSPQYAARPPSWGFRS
jgi:hypothetical protein